MPITPQSEFDLEITAILHAHRLALESQNSIEAIKQAFDKYVIGEDEALEEIVASYGQTRKVKGAIERNQKRAAERQSLWGGK